MISLTNEPDTSTGEEHIIAEFFAPLARYWPGALGLRDDCATITPAPGQDIVVKTDPIRAGVHFFADDAPEDIAWKALAVNVSDLASKAARPLAYTLAVSFPKAPDRTWLHSFTKGLSTAQDAFGCVLIGGDTDHADGPISIAVTIFGETPTGGMVQRVTPSSGDAIYVSGTLGDSALGLKIRSGHLRDSISDEDREYLIARYLRPQPRLGLRAALRAYASSAMDISDGLGKDLGRMCRASSLGALVDQSKLPMSAAFRAVAPGAPEDRRPLLSAGDDYEVLCTVKPEHGDAFRALAAAGNIPVTQVGHVTAGGGVRLVDEAGNGHQWARTGYDHFG